MGCRLFQTRRSTGDPKTGADIWLLPDPLAASGPSKPVPFLRTESRELFPQFSPDGKWIAYYSNETGRQEIYVAPFPGPGEKKRVSASGGVVPRWRRDGRELFYVALDGTLMAAAVAVRNGVLEVTNHSRLFGVLPTAAGYPYDVSADGQRFLTVVAGPGVSTAQLTVVRNWRAAFEK
jgi:eukaryotic-like serine/threonine-protein kinase